jgi:hypothetical protein
MNLSPECEVVFVGYSNIRDGPGTCVHPPFWLLQEASFRSCQC